MKKILSFIMAIGIMALISCSGNSKTPSGTVENYLDCLKSGKYEKAISYFDMDKSEETQVKALAEKMDEALKEQGGIKSYEIVKDSETISEDGTTASVKTVITYGKGDSNENTVKLKKVEEEWKIDIASK